MEISDTIIFDESKTLSQQSAEFQAWYNDNINPHVTLDKKDKDDEFGRPYSFTVYSQGFIITVVWMYIVADSTDWRCKDFSLIIKTKS